MTGTLDAGSSTGVGTGSNLIKTTLKVQGLDKVKSGSRLKRHRCSIDGSSLPLVLLLRYSVEDCGINSR